MDYHRFPMNIVQSARESLLKNRPMLAILLNLNGDVSRHVSDIVI
jgi:hypothetical protein